MRELLSEKEREKYGRDFLNPDTWYASNKTGMRLEDEQHASPYYHRIEAQLTTLLQIVFGSGIWRSSGVARGMCRVPVSDRAETPWTVTHTTWHTDEGTVAQQLLPTVIAVWVFLGSITHQGGGTLMLAGSTRELRRLANEEGATHSNSVTHTRAKAMLAQQDPWCDELFTKPKGGRADRIKRFLEEVSPSLQLKVVENTGEAGDVVLFDPRIFHAEISRNVSEMPRMIMRIDFAQQVLPVEEVSCTPFLQRVLAAARLADEASCGGAACTAVDVEVGSTSAMRYSLGLLGLGLAVVGAAVVLRSRQRK